MGAMIHAQGARERAQEAVREADRAEAEALVRPHGMLRGPGAALPDDRSMLSGGLAWLEVECARCKTREPAIRRHTSA
jgi:hypothetical protein